MVCHAQGISPADDGDKQMSTILPTENQDWGFWGTMREHSADAWRIAFTAIHNATSTDPASVRAFLDSRYGRHFADGVNSQMHHGASLADGDCAEAFASRCLPRGGEQPDQEPPAD
jgi:hypothetical protein